MADIFDNVGGTKFTGFVFIIILGFILVLVKELKTATDFMTFAFGIYGSYVIGNTVSKFSNPEK